MATVILGNEVQGLAGCFGCRARHSCQDLDPGWRSISRTGGCCLGLRVAAFGIGEDSSLEMEVASESIISVVDEEE